MILRCLADDGGLYSIAYRYMTLALAVRADAAGDVKTTREWFDKLEGVEIEELDLLWKKRVEYMFAVDERKAMTTTLKGFTQLSMPVIIHTLEQLLDYSKDDSLKIQIYLYLQSVSSKYTLTGIAQIYEQKGDKLMAREYHEIGGRLGNKDSQRWMVDYLEKKRAESWFKKSALDRELSAWRTLVNIAPQEIPTINDSRHGVE